MRWLRVIEAEKRFIWGERGLTRGFVRPPRADILMGVFVCMCVRTTDFNNIIIRGLLWVL